MTNTCQLRWQREWCSRRDSMFLFLRLHYLPFCNVFWMLFHSFSTPSSKLTMRLAAVPCRGVHQSNEPDNPIQIAPTQPEKSNPKLLGWVVGLVYVNPKLLGWVVGCGSHNLTQPEK